MLKVLIGTAIAAVSATDGKKCIALAMSGGGTKGAFEAGALWGMYHTSEDKKKFEYDLFTGVSAGAINSGGLSVFAKGDEANMLQVLSDTWASLNTGNLYRNWKPFGMISGIMSHTGVVDTYPFG